MKLIAVFGPSGSGKTTFAYNLANAISDGGKQRVAIISMDRYYKCLKHLTDAQRSSHNYDEPDALDIPLFLQHLRDIKEGKVVQLPIYDFVSHTVTGYDEFAPNEYDVVIIDGIMLLTDPQAQALFDYIVYVDVPQHVCLWRRMQRDRKERGRTIDSIINQYAKTVLPGFWRYVRPHRNKSHFIVTGGGNNQHAVQLVATHIRTLG